MRIDTERLYLRNLLKEDVSEKYVSWLNDPDVNKYLEVRQSEQTIESCIKFIQNCNDDPCSNLFGIFEKENGEHIGNAKIGFINKHYQRGQISLFIGEKIFWGKGYSTEVVKALTEHGFNRLGLHRLEAGCYEDNLASLRVFLKNGYAVEGFFRNHFLVNGTRQGCFWLGRLNYEYHG